jgi:hypothetical protein
MLKLSPLSGVDAQMDRLPPPSCRLPIRPDGRRLAQNKGSMPMQRYLTLGAAIAVLATLPACTSPAASDTAPALAARANSCINPLQIKKQKILSDQDIRFEMNNGDIWVNHLAHRCPGLQSEQGFAWDLHGNSVCSNQQIIHVLNEGTSCSLGAFTKQPAKAT